VCPVPKPGRDEYGEAAARCASLPAVNRSIEEWLAGHGVAPSAGPEVIRERHWSTITRIPTGNGDLYLKRCGPIGAYEIPLVTALARRWPDRTPTVVAADAERAWLLMTDAGTTLRHAGRERFAEAVALYAELQVAEVAHVEEFLRMGLPHLSLSWLSDAYGPFVADEPALQALAPRFVELCAELDALELPESIQHDDLHDNNVFLRDGRLAIYDWGDSTVAHPLFSFMKPYEVATRDGTDPAPLREAFLEPWTAYLPRQRLLDALQIALPLARVSYVMQLQRHLDAMPAEDRPPYEEHKRDELRSALAELSALR
jgi:hypothetical protein